MRHDHPLEWAWMAFVLLEVWASSSSWLAAHRDWRRAKAARTAAGIPHLSYSSRDALTKAIEDAAAMNAIRGVALFMAVVASLFLAPPPPPYWQVPQSLFLLSVLIGVSIINAVIAFHGRLIRYRLSTGYYERRPKLAGDVIAEAYQDKEPP